MQCLTKCRSLGDAMTNIGILDASRKDVYLKFLHYLADFKGASLSRISICENLEISDIIIIDNMPDKTFCLDSIAVKNKLHPKISIVNSDIPEAVHLAMSIGGQIITYGFNPKSSVTASSILDNNIVIYVQRAMHTITGVPVYPGEFLLENAGLSSFADCAMGGFAAALVCGIFP